MTTTQLTRPADTSMMRIVHDALRRDLDRLSEVLHETAHPTRTDARHSPATSTGWWSFSSATTPGRTGVCSPSSVNDDRTPALLDDMDRDHTNVADAIDVVTAAIGSDRHLGTSASHSP